MSADKLQNDITVLLYYRSRLSRQNKNIAQVRDKLLVSDESRPAAAEPTEWRTQECAWCGGAGIVVRRQGTVHHNIDDRDADTLQDEEYNRTDFQCGFNILFLDLVESSTYHIFFVFAVLHYYYRERFRWNIRLDLSLILTVSFLHRGNIVRCVDW